MTATTSSKKTSYFGKRYKNNISQNKKSLIIHIVMELMGLPILSILGLIVTYVESLNTTNENKMIIYSGCRAFAIIGIVTTCISLFLGILFALNHFNYLYKKSITDMNYALPLSSSHRFFADYLSGFTMYMAPAVGAILLSIAILGIGTAFVPDMNEFWSSFHIIIRFVFIVLVTMMLFYTLSVLAITFCGNTFEAIFSIFAFNALIPASIACIWLALCKSSSYGIVGEAIVAKNIFTSTSPIGAASFFSLYISGMFDINNTSFSTAVFAKWIIITLIVTAIYLIAAYLLYRHRKAEDVSKPYVYKTAFYSMMTMAVFCVLSLFISYGGFIMAGIVLCAIGWFIMEVITRRGFKKFWQAGIGFTAAIVSVLLICKAFDATNGFGMAKHVPSAASVESVMITCDEIPEYQVYFKDKKVIEEVVKLHEELVDRHFNPDDYDYETVDIEEYSTGNNSYIDFNYSTYTGSSVMRSYALPSGMLSEVVKSALLSDDYAEQIYNSIFSYYYSEYYNNNISLTKRKFHYRNKAGVISSKSVTQAQMDNIRLSYYNDLMAMTEDDLLNADYCGEIEHQYFVLSTFENTIAALEELNINCGDITEKDIEEEILMTKYPVFYTNAEWTFEKSDENEMSPYYYYDYSDMTVNIADSITNINNYYYSDYQYKVNPTDEAIELINRCTTIILGEMPIAVFEVNGNTKYLLDRGDNKELLDKIKPYDAIVTVYD